MNRIKTTFLLTCLTLLLVAMGNLIGGQSGIIIAFLIAGGMKQNHRQHIMFIDNPLTSSSMLKLFSTHPPVKERIARLETLASGKR